MFLEACAHSAHFRINALASSLFLRQKVFAESTTIMLTRSRKKISNESASDIDHKNQSRDKPNKGNREKHKIEFSPDKGAKRRNPARINESIDMKMKTSPDGESSNRSIDDCELETCYNAIKEVLTSKYTNVVDRLNLSFPAKCTRALMECSQNHSKKFVSTIRFRCSCQ